MKKTKGMNLPDRDHVARHVPWKKLRRDGNDKIPGFLPQAFELREGEQSLSVNWLEYYEGNREDRLQEAVNALRSRREINKKDAFGIGNVGKIKSVCLDSGTNVRIVYSPTKSILDHCDIRNIPRDDLAFLAAVAEDAFSELVLNADRPSKL